MPGSPPTSPYLGLPRYSNADAANFSSDINPIVDQLDSVVIRADDARLPLMTSGPIASRPVSTVGSPGKLGRLYISTDEAGGDRIYMDLGTRWLLIAAEANIVQDPTGAVQCYAGAAAPTGWLICDGSAVSRTTYAALFAVIGTTFGVGDNSTTFNLPDMRQRFPLGKSASGTGTTLGSTGGAIDHTHSIPALSVPGLSIPGLSIPGLAVPGLSVPGLSIPALGVVSTVPNLTLFASVGSHTHGLSTAGGAQVTHNSPSGYLFEYGQSGPTYTATLEGGGSPWTAAGIGPFTRSSTALVGNTDATTPSLSGVAVGTTIGGTAATGTTGTGTTGTGTTGTGTTGTGTTGTGSTGTSNTGTQNPPFLTLQFIIKI